MPGKSYKTSTATNGACFEDDLLYRYLEKMTTQEEGERIEQHLNECNHCFADVTALTEMIQTPVTDTEKIEIAQSRQITPEEQVRKILDLVEADRAAVERNQIDDIPAVEPVWGKFAERIANIRRRFDSIWKPAIAWPAIILLLIIGGRPQYLAWRSQVFVDRGLTALTERLTINSREQPRPTGGFKYEEFGATRSEENKSIYESAQANFETALQLKNQNAAAHHCLGTYYLLVEKDFAQAQAEYVLAWSQDSTNASLRNDLGVVAFYQGDYAEAMEQFSRALEQDSHLIEARYNLATLYQNQDRREEARREWEKYLKLDPDSKWSEVARNRLEVL